MDAEELEKFILNNIPTFVDIERLGPGVAYHYTDHGRSIACDGRIRGAPIDRNLDRTQVTIPSVPATEENGVVFAYADRRHAVEEGSISANCEVIELRYRSAVLAAHGQEGSLGAPPTLLILTSDITDFKNIGLCREL